MYLLLHRSVFPSVSVDQFLGMIEQHFVDRGDKFAIPQASDAGQ